MERGPLHSMATQWWYISSHQRGSKFNVLLNASSFCAFVKQKCPKLNCLKPKHIYGKNHGRRWSMTDFKVMETQPSLTFLALITVLAASVIPRPRSQIQACPVAT